MSRTIGTITIMVRMFGETGPVNVTVICQLEDADGHFKNVGQFKLADGYGSWGSSPYTAGPGTIMGARLLSANGAVLATATF